MSKNPKQTNKTSLNNLITPDKMTPEERRERASIMGLASAESRRKRRALREIAEMLLSREIKNDNLRELLENEGFDEKTNQAFMVLRLYETACNTNSKIQVQAYQEIKKLLGEDTPQSVNVNINPPLKEQTERITAVMNEFENEFNSKRD